MAAEDVDGGVAEEGVPDDSEDASQWVADFGSEEALEPPGPKDVLPPLDEEETERVAELLAETAPSDEVPPDPEHPDWGTAWYGKTGEEREQAIRDHFGYTSSEKRTQAERAATAERIKRKVVGAGWQGPIPEDIAKVWCVSERDEITVRTLLAAWGIDVFRKSAIHTAALTEIRIRKEKAILQAAYLAADKKKAK